MNSPPFQKVNRVSQSEWAHTPHALSRAKPGDLLHVGEVEDRKGGILKIRSTGSFLALTSRQAWEGEEVPWPRPDDGVKGAIIEPGTGGVKFIPKGP
jgi:hypothetical protein